MLNKVMLIGRLGRDPELRYTQGGAPVTTLNIATDDNYIDKDGNRVEKTEWHRVVVFQRQAENCANFLGKGSLVYVEGSLQTRKWQDQQGQDRYTTEVKAQRIQFLDRKGDGNGRPPEPEEDEYGQRRQPPNQAQYQGQRNPSNGWERSRDGSGRAQGRQAPPDAGPGNAFPSEGADMDDVPF